ncbi:hypothetical protein HYW46_06335 [Candidatus Daviesbacteria bacterium]|nr:hypothetical protein [Candidatus Daviesbacteria bacterium]
MYYLPAGLPDGSQGRQDLTPALFRLAKWDDFRQADWSEIVDTPDLILQQTRELLQIANA